VSRQMIYNYLDLDDINTWPKDKKVLLLNLLGIKAADELNNIKINTDYILDVESRIDALCEKEDKLNFNTSSNIFNGLSNNKKELLASIIAIVKERLEDDEDDGYYIIKYLSHFLQSLDSKKELKYILCYISKACGTTKPLEFVFNDDDNQFTFESVMFSAMTLYNRGGLSKSRIIESHKKFVGEIEKQQEEKLSRTLELSHNTIQALKELGYTEINYDNAVEIYCKIDEIKLRKK
ncbi:MAG: hypothetical protein RR904_03100, partial [Bacilli bacterium]